MTAFWMAPKSDWSQWMWNILPTLRQLSLLQGTFSRRKACWPLRGIEREKKTRRGNTCYHLSLRWLQWHILINCQTDISWIIPDDWDYLQINSLLSHIPFLMLTLDPANFNHHRQLPLAMDWNKQSKLFIFFKLHLIPGFGFVPQCVTDPYNWDNIREETNHLKHLNWQVWNTCPSPQKPIDCFMWGHSWDSQQFQLMWCGCRLPFWQA